MRIKVYVTQEEYERFVRGEEVETVQILEDTGPRTPKIEILIAEEELLKIEKVENIVPRPYRYTIKKNK